MRVLTASIFFVLFLLPGAASAHSVFGDREPGTSAYVLPGPLVTVGGRACCMDRQSENSFVDIGVEVSAHHFVKDAGSSILNQPGYGALAQLSLGGLSFSGNRRTSDDVGTDLRLALGAEGTLGLLGVQAGPVTRIGSPTYGTSLGVFAGGFFSIGILSVGVQVEAPFAWSDRKAPALFTVPITFKWPAFEIKDRQPTSSRTSS